MSTEPTIKIYGILGGPKQITRTQYVNEWTPHLSQLYNLTVTPEDHKTIQATIKVLRSMAARRWDEIYEKENGHA
jgi:hypothetical protein